MDGISKKIYLELQAPTEDDNRSDQRRIQDGLKEQGIEAKVSLRVLRKLYPLCEEAEWKVTVSLAWDGQTWHGVDLEAGDTTGLHYGVAVDLGSTTVVAVWWTARQERSWAKPARSTGRSHMERTF